MMKGKNQLAKISLLLLLIVPNTRVLSQITIDDQQFGFKLNIPNEWFEYGRVEFDERRMLSEYAMMLPVPDSVDRSTGGWKHSVGYTANANGDIRSLNEFKNRKIAEIEKKYPDFKIDAETDSTLLGFATIHGKEYLFFSCFNFVNGIGYQSDFSTPRELFSEKDKIWLEKVFRSMEFFTPIVDYADIDRQIEEVPEDGTLYYQKAELAWMFHDYPTGLAACNSALEQFPFYGEAFYLKGRIHLSLGDTVEACLNFKRATQEDYIWESDVLNFRDLCDDVELIEPQSKGYFSGFDLDANHLDYVDSVRNHPYFVRGFSGEPKESVLNYMDHVNHLFMLEFDQLDDAFKKERGIAKLYCFGIIVRKFPDLVTKEHRKLLKSKGSIEMLNMSQEGTKTTSVGEVAKVMYSSIEERKKDAKVQAKLEKVVSKFIKTYAKHPKSFEVLEFGEMNEMKVVDLSNNSVEKDSETYSIDLTYKLKNKQGEIVEAYHLFKLNHEFGMNIIEEERSNTVSAYPPRIETWLEQYGRDLKPKEKQKLGLN